MTLKGVDVSPEQVAIAQASGAGHVQQGDYRSVLDGRPRQFAAVTATDLLEYLTKYEVLDAFGAVHGALMPETGVLCGHIVTQNMTFAATKAHPSESSVVQ